MLDGMNATAIAHWMAEYHHCPLVAEEAVSRIRTTRVGTPFTFITVEPQVAVSFTFTSCGIHSARP